MADRHLMGQVVSSVEAQYSMGEDRIDHPFSGHAATGYSHDTSVPLLLNQD